MGSRLLEDRAVAGGMPLWKWVGNRALTWAENRAFGARVVEIPIPTRYFHEASSVSFRSSIAYGLRTLVVLVRFRSHVRGRWANLEAPIGSLRPHDERIARAAARRQPGAA
jgi:hypothetical protein